MRSLYKISLAVLAVGILAFAGSASAQDKPNFTLGADIGVGFGQIAFDKTTTNVTGTADANSKAFSELTTSWETNLKFNWATDSLRVYSRLRIRGSTEGSGGTGTAAANSSAELQKQSDSAFQSSKDDVFTEVWWTPGAFKLGIGKFEGSAWSAPMAGQYEIRNPLPGSDIEYTFVWTGVPGLDAMYNLGAVEVGVAVSTVCYPSCNVVKANNQVLTSTTATTQTAQARTETGTQTITPHVTGAFGPLSFRVQAPQASGTINNNAGTAGAAGVTGKLSPLSGVGVNNGTSKSVSGSGYMAGVSFNASGLIISADVGSFTDDKVADLGQKKNRQRDLTDARVDVPTGGGQKVMVGYAQLEDNVAGTDTTAAAFTAHTYTTTETTVRYYIPVSFGNIIPEYRASVIGGGMTDSSAKVKKDSLGNKISKDASDSIIRVIFRAAF